MDPLNLLKELYGEESIRKLQNSGFDSVGKIATATPESLSFFAGVQEALARQIIESAEELQGTASQKTGVREALAGSVASPTQPRELSRLTAQRKVEAPHSKAAHKELLDDRPLLDVGGLLRSLANEPTPKEFLHGEDILEEVGLSGAEASFLEGISPWPGGSRRERASPVPVEMPPHPGERASGEKREVEFAPVSNWSPEEDPDPIPRLVRTGDLHPESVREEPREEAGPVVPAEPSMRRFKTASKEGPESAPGKSEPNGPKPSLWRFGR